MVGPALGQDPDFCYAVSDSSEELIKIAKDGSGSGISIGDTGVSGIEAIAFRPGGTELYAADSDELGQLDLGSGEYATIGPFGTAGGSAGEIALDDMDSLTFDPVSAELWGASRRSGVEDLLVRIDPLSGAHIPLVFTGGTADYVVINSSAAAGGPVDIDDIAIDPTTGTMYGIATGGGSGERLITINTATGAITDLAALTNGGFNHDDVEGLSFNNTGTLYITTGDFDTLQPDSLLTVNTGTGVTTLVAAFVVGGDYEGSDCLTAAGNQIIGTVFSDLNGDGTYQTGFGESGSSGVTVRLYQDNNGDGLVDGGDTLLQTTSTDTVGEYEFNLLQTGDFVVDIDTSTLPSGATLTTDNVETASFVGTGNRDSDNDFGHDGDPNGDDTDICYAVADNDGLGSADVLMAMNKTTAVVTTIGNTGTFAIEAIALDPETDRLYAADDGQLGILDINTGNFMAFPDAMGTCDLSGGGTVAIDDVDGLFFDPFTGVLWGALRAGGAASNPDYVLNIDKTTGRVVEDAFGAGVDCLPVSPIPPLFGDLDDLAIDPTDGTLYAIDNSAGTGDQLISINKTTGVATVIGTLTAGGSVADMEGLTFFNDGQMFGTTGNNSVPATNGDSLWQIDKTTGATTLVGAFGTQEDYESAACLTAAANRLAGTVYLDVDGDGTFEPANGETGEEGVTVRLYIDSNSDGLVDGGDTLIQTAITDSSGQYGFALAAEGNFVVDIDTGDVPAGATLTTDNVEGAIFTGFGNFDPNNDFGFLGSAIDVDKTSNVVGSVSPGDTITYTITATNNTGATQTGIQVIDALPANTSYVTESTSVVGRLDVFRVTEYFLNTGDFIDDDYNLTLDRDLEEDYFVIIQGSDGAGGSANSNRRGPDENYAALRADPFGTGDLGFSGASNVLTLQRDNDRDSWVGVVTVVECVTDCDANGFRLRDVQRTIHPNGSSSGTDTSGTAWADINQVLLMGGFNGAGCFSNDAATSDHTACHVRLFPSGTDTINWTRDPGQSTPNSTATSTVMVVEWGSDWTVQRVNVQDASANGGNGVNAVGEYTTAAISSVTRDDTWVWGTGFTDDNGVGDAAEGAVITLGDGVNQNATETTVAVGFEFTEDIDFDVYVMTHNDMAVDYRFKTDGNSADLTFDQTVDSATEDRMALSYNGAGATNNEYPRAIFSARYLNDTTVRLERRRSGADFPAWIQGIDFSGIRPLVTKDNLPAGANADLTDGTPDALVGIADGFQILDGETLTVTFQVTVDSPLDPNVTRILNSAVVDSFESPPGTDSVNDPVSSGGTIGDRVWLDSDGDGFQDVGEPGLANVTLTLFNAGGDGMIGGGDDSVVGTALTGTNGEYLFDHLPPGTYYVDVTSGVPAGLTLSPGSTDPSGTIVITAEEEILTADFGYTTSGDAIIGDTVWSDADSDGLRDPGEAGIESVTVELLSPGADGILGTGDDVVEATTTTGPDGSYLFTGVSAGDYLVRVDTTSPALTGYTLTTGPQSISNPSVPITVATGDVYLDADFGFNNPSTFSIDDELWLDIDGDGTRDVGETGFANVVINLLDASGDVVATTTSDANGEFSFTGLANGSYSLDVVDSGDILVGFGGTTAPATAANLAVVVAGANVSGTNFGYNAPGVIGDTVWSDADGDGIQDAGEAGLSGVTVQLWVDANGDDVFDSTVDTLVDTAVTDAAGNYLFDGLIYGTYFASVDDGQAALTGYTPTTTDEELGANAGGTQIEYSLVTLGDAFLGADFGYQNTALPDVSGNVFEDLDIDGLDDGVGEPGIEGVTIALVNSSGVTVATTTTDSNGDYTFPDVAAGDYTVTVTDDAAVLDGYTLTSGLDAIDITVAASDITGIDFGYVRGATTASLGDRVWLDGDSDGVQDGAENGIAGVTVELYDPGPNGVVGGGDDVLLASTTTDINGNYRFTGLAPGDYYAEVDTTTLPSAGASLTATTSNPTSVINLSEGENYIDADFGFGSSGGVGAIGDFVWYDLDGDGIQDPGEIGIGGVTIEITGPGCAPCSTVTDADGSYLFTGLTLGNYNVVYDPTSLPAGYNTTATNAADYDIVLVAGEIIPTADFGFDGGTVGTIGDFVWYDADGDGVQDGGEPGIGGVTLNLLDNATGNILATTVTDGAGAYDFVGVPAGSYRVEVSDIDGVLDGLSLSGGTNPTSTIVLAAGGDENGADFGYEPVLGSIGNLVWRDLNGDGDVDAGESGFEGVTIDLWLDVDNDGVVDPGTDNLLRQTTTDSEGEYSFTGLPAGNYLVDVTDENGVLAGFTLTSGVADTDNNSQSDPYAVTLTSGSLDTVAADFGYTVTSGALSISGITFFDLDGMGDVDVVDDFGVPNITVTLYRDLDGDGVLDRSDPAIDSLLSIAGGAYQFDNLPPGDYIVVANANGTFLDGSRQTTQLGTSAVQPVTLVASNSTDNDFGFTRRATLAMMAGFRAFVDDGDVVVEWQTASETNIAGFYVYRYDELADEYLLLDGDLLPALFGAPQGGVYRFVDPLASAGQEESLTYVLVEVEARGGELVHGPYRVTLEDVPTIDEAWPLKHGETADTVRFKPTDGRFEARPRAASSFDLKRFAQHRAMPSAPAVPPKLGLGNEVMKLRTRGEGLKRVDAQAMADLLGRPLRFVRNRLFNGGFTLSTDGREVDWLPTEDGSALLFYGEGIDSPYTLDRVYWLEALPGSQMQVVTGIGATAGAVESFREEQTFEQDFIPALVVGRDPDEDFWQWAGISAGHSSSGRAFFNLALNDLAPSTGTTTLWVRLQGASETDVPQEHHAVVKVNGVEVGETFFDNFEAHRASFVVDETLLVDGLNSVEVTGLLDTGTASSLFFVDDFELEYARFYRALGEQLVADTADHGRITVEGFNRDNILVFDVADAKHPRWLADVDVTNNGVSWQASFRTLGKNRAFLAVSGDAIETVQPVLDRSSNLRSTDQRYEYLLVTQGEWFDSAERLARHREDQGYRVLRVDIEDVMDEFNFGHFDPRALKTFFRYAHERWKVGPEKILLAGDGNFDYRDLFGLGSNPIPPVLVGTPFGLFASDNWLVDFNEDFMPDLQIGRLPVMNAFELEAVTWKILGYEGTASCTDEKVILAADNTDEGGNFRALSELVPGFLPGADFERIYLDDQVLAAARTQLLTELSAGAEVVHYLGHGGVDRLAEEGLMTLADIPGLGNGDRLPVVTSLTCTSARFEIPGFSSLGEALVLAPDEGAVAFWSPTGLAHSFDSEVLSRAFMTAYDDPRLTTLGEMIERSLLTSSQNGFYPYPLQLFTLIGDPATVVRRCE